MHVPGHTTTQPTQGNYVQNNPTVSSAWQTFLDSYTPPDEYAAHKDKLDETLTGIWEDDWNQPYVRINQGEGRATFTNDARPGLGDYQSVDTLDVYTGIPEHAGTETFEEYPFFLSHPETMYNNLLHEGVHAEQYNVPNTVRDSLDTAHSQQYHTFGDLGSYGGISRFDPKFSYDDQPLKYGGMNYAAPMTFTQLMDYNKHLINEGEDFVNWGNILQNPHGSGYFVPYNKDEMNLNFRPTVEFEAHSVLYPELTKKIDAEVNPKGDWTE